MTPEQRREIMKGEHRYWTQAFNICISDQYSLTKTSYFGTVLVMYLFFDLADQISLN